MSPGRPKKINDLITENQFEYCLDPGIWKEDIYILDVRPLWRINFYVSAFNWLKIKNKYGFRLANRFAQREFFKFFVTNDNHVKTDEFGRNSHPSPFQIPGLISTLKFYSHKVFCMFCPYITLFLGGPSYCVQYDFAGFFGLLSIWR